MAPSRTHEIVKRMYECEEWSDLKIVNAAGSVFNVHKSVVCAASPFFRAACDNHWMEGRNGVIELPEDTVVIDALLRHCYGISDPGSHYCAKTLEILVAANKYHLPELEQDMRDHYTNGIASDKQWVQNIETGVWVYQEERRTLLGSKIVKQVLEDIAWEMGNIVSSCEAKAWENLQSCPELLKDVMRFIASRSDRCWNEGVEFEEPEYLREGG